MLYPPRLVTPPTAEPISVACLREHLRTEPHEDAYLTGLIPAARKLAEDQFELAFSSQVWLLAADCWWGAAGLLLPRPPHISVDSITYLDTADAQQTLAVSEYVFDPDTRLLQWATNADIPELSQLRGAVKITFTSGFATVPEQTRQALLLLCGHFYENREALTEGIIPTEIELAFTHLMLSVTEDYL